MDYIIYSLKDGSTIYSRNSCPCLGGLHTSHLVYIMDSPDQASQITSVPLDR